MLFDYDLTANGKHQSYRNVSLISLPFRQCTEVARAKQLIKQYLRLERESLKKSQRERERKSASIFAQKNAQKWARKYRDGIIPSLRSFPRYYC